MTFISVVPSHFSSPATNIYLLDIKTPSLTHISNRIKRPFPKSSYPCLWIKQCKGARG